MLKIARILLRRKRQRNRLEIIAALVAQALSYFISKTRGYVSMPPFKYNIIFMFLGPKVWSIWYTTSIYLGCICSCANYLFHSSQFLAAFIISPVSCPSCFVTTFYIWHQPITKCISGHFLNLRPPQLDQRPKSMRNRQKLHLRILPYGVVTYGAIIAEEVTSSILDFIEWL